MVGGEHWQRDRLRVDPELVDRGRADRRLAPVFELVRIVVFEEADLLRIAVDLAAACNRLPRIDEDAWEVPEETVAGRHVAAERNGDLALGYVAALFVAGVLRGQPVDRGEDDDDARVGASVIDRAARRLIEVTLERSSIAFASALTTKPNSSTPLAVYGGRGTCRPPWLT